MSFFQNLFKPKKSSQNAFKYIVLGGGNSAGYAAREFVAKGIEAGELCIITEEGYVAYERPALSKAYLFPENPARLPGFYTTVGGGGERQTLDWYQDKGIAYKLNTKIIRVDIQGKTLTAEGGTQFTFEKLIVATGCRPLTLKDFKMKGADHDKLYYLRNVQDADKLIEGMKKAKVGAKGGKVVALGFAANSTISDLIIYFVFEVIPNSIIKDGCWSYLCCTHSPCQSQTCWSCSSQSSKGPCKHSCHVS
eukprot:TRINITY_DN879_c0_g1_i2.p1 TRINITY_DN879_c0_g1~~TRINITY_DN879_c0_g1_i2.p1  ORF type:complete len:250 (-),score=34.65 TRINITY_DN879_c0_g1_i2:319-1068(-)